MSARLALSAVTAMAAVVVAACGGSDHQAATAPSTSSPTVSRDACRAYDNAIAMFSQGIDGDHVPFVIQQFGPVAAEKIRTAAQLTNGPPRTTMEASATRIQVLVDKNGVDDGPEAKAVKDSINAVDALCRGAGASLSNVPAPGISASPE